MSIWYLYFNFHTFLSIVNFYIISISAIHVPHRFNDLGLALCPAVLEGRQQGQSGGSQEMGGEVLVKKARNGSSSNKFDIWHFVTFERQLFSKGLFTYYISRRRGGRGYGKCWPLLTKGGGGVSRKLTIADEGGGGGKANADHCWQRGLGSEKCSKKGDYGYWECG